MLIGPRSSSATGARRFLKPCTLNELSRIGGTLCCGARGGQGAHTSTPETGMTHLLGSDRYPGDGCHPSFGVGSIPGDGCYPSSACRGGPSASIRVFRPYRGRAREALL